MTNLAVFNLPAVVRFAREDLRKLLLEAINETRAWDIQYKEVMWKGSLSKVVEYLYGLRRNAAPTAEEIRETECLFTLKVKAYFIQKDDAFEIRPGVQSIFGHIEKEKNWKYCIISDYWDEATHFILQSCGVFSKNKLTMTAEDGLTPDEQIKKVIRRLRKKSKDEPAVYLVNGDQSRIRLMLKKEISPRFEKDKANYFYYPRFSQLFKAR